LSCTKKIDHHKFGLDDVGFGTNKKAAFCNLEKNIWKKVRAKRKNHMCSKMGKSCKTALSIFFDETTSQIVKDKKRYNINFFGADGGIICKPVNNGVPFSSYCFSTS